MWQLLSLCMFGLGASCAQTDGATYNTPHIIENYRGGYLNDAMAERARLAAWGGPVQIKGVCNSACVMMTTLPNACLDPDLRLGFHRSQSAVGSWLGNRQLAQFFRAGIRQQYEDVWSQLPQGQSHTITAQDYVRLDPQARICGD